MDTKKFNKIAESLRQYRRADLKDFEQEIGSQPVDALYVDPLPSDGVLETVLSSNTTFLLGRKGTGKSTVFSRAQSQIRKQNRDISIYVDVKTLYDLMGASDAVVKDIANIAPEVLQSHQLRKSFLGSVLSDLIKEIKESCKRLSLLERWLGRKRDFEGMEQSLAALQERVKTGKLTVEEIPILQRVSMKTKERAQHSEKTQAGAEFGGQMSLSDASINSSINAAAIDELLSDDEIYAEYSDAILRSFPYSAIMEEITDLLDEVKMKRLVIFFDDFSELSMLNQQLFVDTVLAPLNNSSDEKIKLKVAGYPGRVYFGTIDPGKIDTICLDFSSLYKNQDIQSAENAAVDYTTRLLSHRFTAFGVNVADYFDPSTPLVDYMRLMFEATFNVPRLMGYLLHYCYRDRIAREQLITPAALRLASKKYYEDILSKYFDRTNRYALEPYERKLDRHNQHELLKTLVSEARDVRRRIVSGEVGGRYFDGLTNPPVSHFTITPKLESILSSLELNFLVTKYHDMRDKDGDDVSVYALYYGLCESERLPWGYPRGRRDDRSYFVQRCFSFNSTLHQFLAKRQTIRCGGCGASFPIDKKEHLAFYKWKCPECSNGTCSVVNLADDYRDEIDKLNHDIMLEEVELDILGVLNDEQEKMRAGEISALIDVTYQLVGRRTSKLQERGLVEKELDCGVSKSMITQRARQLYFQEGKQ